MLVAEPPSPKTFNSNEGEPETVPVVEIVDAFAGTVMVKSLRIGGAPGSRGSEELCCIVITTLPLASNFAEVTAGFPSVCVALLPVNRFSLWPAFPIPGSNNGEEPEGSFD